MRPRPAKWTRRAWRCAGQSQPFRQKWFAPESSTGRAQTGHSPGIVQAAPSPSRSGETVRTTCGITSPARCTSTRSPGRAPSACTIASLWRLARRTTTPATSTAARCATGVSLPVRPTWIPISSRVVSAVSGGNLQAAAQRGLRDRTPISSWSSTRSTLTTAPSSSTGSASRPASSRRR